MISHEVAISLVQLRATTLRTVRLCCLVQIQPRWKVTQGSLYQAESVAVENCKLDRKSGNSLVDKACILHWLMYQIHLSSSHPSLILSTIVLLRITAVKLCIIISWNH